MSCEVVAAAEGRVARLAGLGIDLLASARYSVSLKNASQHLPPLPTQLTLGEWQASNLDPFKDLGTHYQHIESFSKGTMNFKNSSCCPPSSSQPFDLLHSSRLNCVSIV